MYIYIRNLRSQTRVKLKPVKPDVKAVEADVKLDARTTKTKLLNRISFKTGKYKV